MASANKELFVALTAPHCQAERSDHVALIINLVHVTTQAYSKLMHAAGGHANVPAPPADDGCRGKSA